MERKNLKIEHTKSERTKIVRGCTQVAAETSPRRKVRRKAKLREEGSPHQFKVEEEEEEDLQRSSFTVVVEENEERVTISTRHGKAKKIERKVAKLPRPSSLVERMRNCDLVGVKKG